MEKEFLDTVSMREVPQHIYLKARELEHYMLMNGFQELAGIKLRSYKPNFCGEPEFECKHDIKGWCHSCSIYKEPVSDKIKSLAEDIIKLNTPDKELVSEWRIRHTKEYIEEGDEYDSSPFWLPVPKQWVGQMVVSRPIIRTKRALPKKQEMPIDTLWTQVLPHRKEKNGDMADALGCIYECLIHLNEQINILKKAKQS
jgi:hypothetical protein